MNHMKLNTEIYGAFRSLSNEQKSDVYSYIETLKKETKRRDVKKQRAIRQINYALKTGSTF